MKDLCHPLVTRWFQQTFGEPTAPQIAGWAHIAAGQDTLIAAPTGSGKTLAAFLWAIDTLVRTAIDATLENHTYVVYISPPYCLHRQRKCSGSWSAEAWSRAMGSRVSGSCSRRKRSAACRTDGCARCVAACEGLIPVGRWSLLRESRTTHPTKERSTEAIARQLLRRYGVMTRELLKRESFAPSWRELLSVYWRLEVRGEIRGGRFVAGLVGEQFALPEAVEMLRAVRRKPVLSSVEGPEEAETIIVSAADPLNLVGILLPGPLLNPLSGKVIAYRAGIPVAVGDLGAVRRELRQFQV